MVATMPFTTTRIYEEAERIALDYVAWVWQHEGRKLSKEAAINELVVKAGKGTLPAEFRAAFSGDKKNKK